MVNARLGKEEFDCNALEGTYDCGCGGEEEDDIVEEETGAIASETKGTEVDARPGETETTPVKLAEVTVTPPVAHT